MAGDLLCAVESVQLLVPVVASEVQPVTVPSKFWLQIAPMTVKAAARVEVSKLGLVATTFQAPAAAPVRLTWQRCVPPINWPPVATMSPWPERASLTAVSARKPVPVRSSVTVPDEGPLLGETELRTRGSGGGASAEEPESSSE